MTQILLLISDLTANSGRPQLMWGQDTLGKCEEIIPACCGLKNKIILQQNHLKK